MPKKFSHHFQEGFSKHARKIYRSCQEGGFCVCLFLGFFLVGPKKIMPERFFRSCHLKGFSNDARKIFQIMSRRDFQMIPERFFRSVKKGFSNYARKISQIMSRRGFQTMPETFFRSSQEKVFQIMPERFFQIMSRRVFQIMPERFFRSSQRRGFQIMPERFFRSSEESSNKLVKSADIMCMMEQILES
jgi:hypothetical protein